MKRLAVALCLVALLLSGCGKSDPYAKYRDAQLKYRMKISEVKWNLGEPDHYSDHWRKAPDDDTDKSKKQDLEHPHHVERLYYGAFGAHHPMAGHITKHRLSLTFINGELYDWEKSTPCGSK